MYFFLKIGHNNRRCVKTCTCLYAQVERELFDVDFRGMFSNNIRREKSNTQFMTFEICP